MNTTERNISQKFEKQEKASRTFFSDYYGAVFVTLALFAALFVGINQLVSLPKDIACSVISQDLEKGTAVVTGPTSLGKVSFQLELRSKKSAPESLLHAIGSALTKQNQVKKWVVNATRVKQSDTQLWEIQYPVPQGEYAVVQVFYCEPQVSLFHALFG